MGLSFLDQGCREGGRMTQGRYERAVNYSSHVRRIVPVRAFPRLPHLWLRERSVSADGAGGRLQPHRLGNVKHWSAPWLRPSSIASQIRNRITTEPNTPLSLPWCFRLHWAQNQTETPSHGAEEDLNPTSSLGQQQDKTPPNSLSPSAPHKLVHVAPTPRRWLFKV